MELQKAIVERRSIRKYTDRKVERNLLEELLKKSFWAPSGRNRQGWKYVVFEGEALRRLIDFSAGVADTLDEGLDEEKFNDKMKKLVKGYFKNLGGASVAVAAFSKRVEGPEGFAEIYSAAAMFYNFLLLAYEAGLGTCWMTGYLNREEELLRLFGLEGYTLVGLTPVGYADQKPPTPPRKHEEIIWLS